MQAIVLRKSNLPASTNIGVVIGHFLAWAVFVGLPIYPLITDLSLFVWDEVRAHLVMSLRSALFFYLVYGVLIPRFLACGGLIRFFLSLILVAASFGVGYAAIDKLLITQFDFTPTSMNGSLSMWKTITLWTTYSVVLGFIALAGRFTFDWFAISRAYHRYLLQEGQFAEVLSESPDDTKTVDYEPDVTNSGMVFHADGASAVRKGSIWVRSGGETVKVDLDRLWYIEGMKDYVAYIGPWGKILVHQRLKEVEASLPGRSFRRIHRSYIVSWSKVERFSGSHVVLAGREIPVGSTYKARL